MPSPCVFGADVSQFNTVNLVNRMPSKLRWMILYMLSAAVASCATEAPRSVARPNEAVESEPRQQAGPSETVRLGHPVIRALVLPVQEGTTVEPVSGTVYITRHGREAIDLKAKETLQHDDLLQLQRDSSARMRSPSGAELVLTAQHGEWFRFVVDDK